MLIQSRRFEGNMMDTIPEFRRDVLVSIRPYYASKLLDGKKTVELRRKFPEVGVIGVTALIYSSSPVRAIVGYARIKQVLKLPVSKLWREHGATACISKGEFDAYFSGLRDGFAIVFEGVQALKKQFTAADLEAQFGIVPPQSYRYVGEDCVALISDEQHQTSHRHTRRHRAGRPPARAGVTR
jgi:predicted transcriptional regulator